MMIFQADVLTDFSKLNIFSLLCSATEKSTNAMNYVMATFLLESLPPVPRSIPLGEFRGQWGICNLILVSESPHKSPLMARPRPELRMATPILSQDWASISAFLADST